MRLKSHSLCCSLRCFYNKHTRICIVVSIVILYYYYYYYYYHHHNYPLSLHYRILVCPQRVRVSLTKHFEFILLPNTFYLYILLSSSFRQFILMYPVVRILRVKQSNTQAEMLVIRIISYAFEFD
jgi:hypothetical protein